MKIQKETALFQVPFGSHLYGTSTPASDLDAKVVCLPSHEDLLMNYRLTNRVVKPEGWIQGEKMKAGETEFEFIPLQIFLDHFFEGQTYALEIAFAVLSDMHVTLEYDYGDLAVTADSEFIKGWMGELVNRFLTRDVKKMVGYAKSQSEHYGLKTERYNTLLKIRDIINTLDPSKMNGKLRDAPELLAEVLKTDYVQFTMIMNGAGGTEEVPGIEINGKQFAHSTSWKTILASVEKTLKGYGNRVKDHTGEPTDWKALSHAIRIGGQIIELLKNGSMMFPRIEASFLLSVKQGKVPLEEATKVLTDLFNDIDGSIEASVLQEKTPKLIEEFEEFKLDLLRKYYRL